MSGAIITPGIVLWSWPQYPESPGGAEVRRALAEAIFRSEHRKCSQRTLGPEEDLGFETLHALDEPMQRVAIVDPKAFQDIATVDSRTVALKGQPSGLSASKMGGKPFDALRSLVELYIRNIPDDMARRRLDQIDKAGREVWFSWAGGTKPGGSHYYRVQTKSFLLVMVWYAFSPSPATKSSNVVR